MPLQRTPPLMLEPPFSDSNLGSFVLLSLHCKVLTGVCMYESSFACSVRVEAASKGGRRPIGSLPVLVNMVGIWVQKAEQFRD